PIVVRNNGMGTPQFMAKVKAAAPSFLRFGASRYAVATHADYRLLAPATLYPGLSTPAAPGEVILLWSAGFGLPLEGLDPGASSQFGHMPENPVCTIGGHPADVSAALVSPGLYQLNLTVPPDVLRGDNPLTCTYRGTATQDGVLLTVQ
ncbi:MAG: hypothetical protein ABI693_31005, partial [Bryobacteraceae bacterium]